MTKKGLERRIYDEERYIPQDKKQLDELGLKLDNTLREIEEVKKEHENLNKLGVINKISSKEEVKKSKELSRLLKEGMNIVRA